MWAPCIYERTSRKTFPYKTHIFASCTHICCTYFDTSFSCWRNIDLIYHLRNDRFCIDFLLLLNEFMLNTFLVFTLIFSWWKKLNKTKTMKWKIECLKISNLLHISKLILIFSLFSYNDRINPIITFHTIRKLFETHCERTVFAWYSLLWARHLLWCQNKWFVLTFLMWTATVTFHTWSRRKLNDFIELSLRKND